jgi:hypothetical protein
VARLMDYGTTAETVPPLLLVTVTLVGLGVITLKFVR